PGPSRILRLHGRPRISRMLNRRRRLFLQERQTFLHGPLQLWVPAFGNRRSVQLHFDIWWHALVLGNPFVLYRIEYGIDRRRHRAAIHERIVNRSCDKPAPGPRSDQRPHLLMPEDPGEEIPTRSGQLIDEQHLWTQYARRQTESRPSRSLIRNGSP